MQLSIVLSQRTWPQVGDLDDCWVLSSLQAVLACAPWSYLVGTKDFRHAAGDPDDGKRDGGSIREIVKAIRALYPDVAEHIDPFRGVPFERLVDLVEADRPVSVALMTGKLPARLRYGAGDVAHQCTLARRSTGGIAFANPLAPMGSRWDNVQWTEIRPAIRDYGNGLAYGVAFPMPATMAPAAPGFAKALADAVAKLPKPDCSAAEAAAFADAKAKAIAAVGTITP